jgi:tetratricopeptide (TPR) repeat protein
MKKGRIVLSVALLVIAGIAIYFAVWRSLPSKLPNTALGELNCDQWGIGFDSTSVDRIYQNPGSIIEDPLTFWKEDPAYQLVALSPWYREGKYPPAEWVEDIERVQSLSTEKRKDDPPKARSQEILDYQDIYCSNAIPVITSVLPEETSLDTKVYLSAFNDPEGFAYRSAIVMNVGSKSYFGKTSKFFNILSHEIFHIGYFNHQPHQSEVWPDNYPLHVILVTLQNDGIAVYLQSELHDLYAAPLEIELMLLESDLAVKFFMSRVNNLLKTSNSLDEAESMVQAFSGLNQTALYVVGATMAQAIEEELGIEALVGTVSEGPRSFIQVYNSVADEGMKIQEIEDSEDLTPIQNLRKAAVDEDYGMIERIMVSLQEDGISNPGGIEFESIMSTGLVLQSQDKLDLSNAVFELLVEIFPDYPSSYIYLGDSYAGIGEIENAKDAYRKASELDSRYSTIFSQALEGQ